MTDYAPRGGQDLNHFYANPHLTMSHYSNGNGVAYLYSNGQIQYPAVNASYPTYSAPYVPTQNATTAPMYMPNPSPMSMQYQLPPGRVATLPSQARALPQTSYYSPHLQSHRPPSHHPRLTLPSDLQPMADTEPQESFNDVTMLSEPLDVPLEGYPDVHEFDNLMER